MYFKWILVGHGCACILDTRRHSTKHFRLPLFLIICRDALRRLPDSCWGSYCYLLRVYTLSVVHIIFGTDIHVYDASLDIHHYFWGVDTLITHSWVMVVSSQSYCISLLVQYFIFLPRRPNLWKTRVCIYSGLWMIYFPAFILDISLLRLELRLVGVYVCYLYVFEEFGHVGRFGV